MPQMHCSLKAYCATLTPTHTHTQPHTALDVPTFATKRLHVLTTREPLAAKGGTMWARMVPGNFA
jgi:hypothetical protein